jgi:hypothetical protein
MLDIINENLTKVKSIVKEINALNRVSAIRNMDKRVELMLLAMSFIQKCQNDFLDYKIEKKDFDIPELINLDFEISQFANRLYKGASQLLNVFVSTNENKKIDELFLKYRARFFELTKVMMNISARWDIERFINVYEYDMSNENKAFPKRRVLLSTCIFFANRMNATKLGIKFIDGIMPKRIIFSTQPSSGKSYIENVYSVIAIIMHFLYYDTSGILRMSNNATNANGFSSQIRGMLEDGKIMIIFPELKRYFNNFKCRLFEKQTDEEWKLKDLNPRIRASFFARGRDSAINSLRIFVALMIDDLSDGFDQMNNDEAHQQMVSKYYIDMDSRKEEENLPEFITGTMFNEFDIINAVIRKLEEEHLLIADGNYAEYEIVRHTSDYSTVVIQVDCFDKKMESVAPDLISTKKLLDKMDMLKPYQFELVFRQMRASREPRTFDYSALQTYKELPKTLSNFAYGAIDPTRKSGNDYFSFPIIRYNEPNDKFYFTNVIYEQKSLGAVSDPNNKFLEKTVDFIISEAITNLTIENNTSNTIGSILIEHLKNKGYNSCKINEIYASSNKSKVGKIERILNQEATIKNNIVFPEKAFFPPQHPITQFMYHLTHFDSKNNVGKKTNPDDAPDSLALLSSSYIFNKSKILPQVETITKKRLWR